MQPAIAANSLSCEERIEKRRHQSRSYRQPSQMSKVEGVYRSVNGLRSIRIVHRNTVASGMSLLNFSVCGFQFAPCGIASSSPIDPSLCIGDIRLPCADVIWSQSSSYFGPGEGVVTPTPVCMIATQREVGNPQSGHGADQNLSSFLAAPTSGRVQSTIMPWFKCF